MKSIKKLEINEQNKISNFDEFYNLTSLEELVIEYQNLNNLNGIQNCPSLKKVFLKGCNLGEYEAIGKLENRLETFWLYNIDDNELEKVCNKENGLGKYNLNNLKSFAISGNTEYICSENNYVSSWKSGKTITNLSPILNLTDITKKAIQSLSIQNNNLSEINELSDFENITLLRMEYNKLVNLNGLENLKKLKYLNVANNNLGVNETNIKDEKNDVLKVLEDKYELYYLNLSNNIEIRWMEYLKNCKKLENLYLTNNTKMNGESLATLIPVIKQCGSNYSIPPEYSLLLIGDANVIDLSNQTISKDNFLLLKNKEQITHLNLKNIKLLNEKGSLLGEQDVNDIVNDVLSTLVKMQYLQLETSNSDYSLSKLYNISFVQDMKNLIELGLIGTNISTSEFEKGKEVGLKLLNDNCDNLGIVAINQDNINLADIEKTVKKCMTQANEPYWQNVANRTFICSNPNTLKTLENCTNLSNIYLTGGVNYNITLDFSKFKNLEKYDTGWSETPDVILPESVTNVGLGSFSRTCDVSRCKHILEFYHSGYPSETNLRTTLSTISEDCIIDSLQLRRETLSRYTDLHILSSIKSKNIKQLYLYPNADNTSINTLDGIENLVNLEEFISNSFVEISDISKLKNLTKLKKISIYKSKVNDISSLKELENLEYLDISNSSITSLKPLENLKKLQYLNLQNNCIYDTSSYINSDGKEVVYKNLEIIKNLYGYSLKKIYLSGNKGITNFNLISNLKWEEKNGF